MPLELTEQASSRLDTQIRQVARDLASRYRVLSEDQLRTWGEEERDRLLEHARFPDFVPVLVHSHLNARVRAHTRPRVRGAGDQPRAGR